MSLFSRIKKSHPTPNASSAKKFAQLTCPECGFKQQESMMAVSTFCRGCSTHYKIRNGKALPIIKNPSNPYASPNNPPSAPKLRNHRGGTQASKSNNEAKNKTASKTTDTRQHPARVAPPTPAIVKKAAASTGFFQTKTAPREVRCFECDHVHKAAAESSSTLCPACGAYIGLKDYDIRDNWNRRIQTRGNVVIHKKAVVTGITIRSHHLTVHGKLTGGVDCSGDFTLRSHGKIMGKVRCKRLIIEKRAHVEFSNTVICEDVIIDGEVKGNFHCSGKLRLKKKATLTGNIKVATMVVEEGARHHGSMSIGQ